MVNSRKIMAFAMVFTMVLSSVSVLVAQGMENSTAPSAAFEHGDIDARSPAMGPINEEEHPGILDADTGMKRGLAGEKEMPPNLWDGHRHLDIKEDTAAIDGPSSDYERYLDDLTLPDSEQRWTDEKNSKISHDGPEAPAANHAAPAIELSSAPERVSWASNAEPGHAYSSGTPPVIADSTVNVFNIDNGTNYSSIQEAVNNASDGDHLVINGTAVEDVFIDGKDLFIVSSNFSFMGDLTINSTGGLTIDPSHMNITGNLSVSGSLVIENNTVVQFNSSYNGESGIRVNAGATLEILNNSIFRSNSSARYWFHVLPFAHLEIENSTIRDCGWDIDHEPGLTIMADGAAIRNSTFTNDLAGIVLIGSDMTLIKNSTFYGNDGGGIGVVDHSEHILIENNSFDGGEGVHSENSSYVTIRNNSMADMDYGVYSYNSTGLDISENTIRGYYGVYLDMSDTNDVTNNTIDAYRGIYLKSSDDDDISGNDIHYLEPAPPTGNVSVYGLIGYWRMDEITGGKVRDSSGNGNDGAAAYEVALEDNGVRGKYADLPGGSDSHIGDIDSDSFNTGNGLTLEAWIYANSQWNDQKIIGKTTDSPNIQGYILGIGNSRIYPEIWDASGTRHTLQAGRIGNRVWTHIAVTWESGGRMVAYVNGMEVGNISAGVGLIPSTDNSLIIGAAPWDPDYYAFDGRIDEVRVYNRSLSGREIMEDYRDVMGGFGIYMKDSVNSNISGGAGSSISGFIGSSIYLEGSSPDINNVHLSGRNGFPSWGLVCLNGSSPAMSYSRMETSIETHVYADGNSHPKLIDTEFGWHRSVVSDKTSDISCMWHMYIHAHYGDGSPAQAPVYLLSRNGTYWNAGDTDSSGNLTLVEKEYVINHTGRQMLTPYNVYVDDGSIYGSQTASLGYPQHVDIELGLQYVHNRDLDTYYAGISVAILSARPGDHIDILHAGLYNESVLVDREIHITGRATPLPAVIGGDDFAFLIRSERVEISNINISYGEGIMAYAGGFNIHDNVFKEDESALYVDIDRSGGDALYIGDMNFHDNTLNMSGGVYIYEGFTSPTSAENVFVGNISIIDNVMDVSDTDAIYVRSYAEGLLGSTVFWGNIEIINNTIQAPDGRGVDIYSYVYNITDSQLSLGGYTISNNDINSGSGVRVDCWDVEDIYGKSTVNTGDMSITDNAVESGGFGITVYSDVVDGLYDDASVNIGASYVINNHVASDYGSISIYMEEVGNEMHGDATLMMGETVVRMNHVESEGSGIVAVMENSVTDIHDHAHIYFEMVSICDNIVNSSGDSIEYFIADSASEMNNMSSLRIAGADISNNTVNSTNGGIIAAMEHVGQELQDDFSGSLTLEFGDISIRDNEINTEGDAIQAIIGRSFNEVMLSDIRLPSWNINDNTVNSTANGGVFAIFKCMTHIFGTSVTSGDLDFSGNNISSGKDAYAFVFGDIGRDIYDTEISLGANRIYDNSFNGSNAVSIDVMGLAYETDMDSEFSFGGVSFTNNSIIAEGTGIVANWEENAEKLAGTSRAYFGDLLVNDNEITSIEAEGIFLDNFESNGFGLKDLAEAHFGNFEFNRNNISSDGTGIYIGSWEGWGIDLSYDDEMGEPIPGACTFTMGHVQFNNNEILSNDSGIYIHKFSEIAVEIYGSSKATIGDIEFSNNSINSTGTGIDIYEMVGFGVDLYDFSVVNMGSIRFNDNKINSFNGFGIRINDKGGMGEIGGDMDGYSRFSGSNIEMCHNTINSTSTAIYAYLFLIVGEMNEKASSSFGSILLNDNTVRSGRGGITLDLWGLVTSMEDESDGSVSSIEVQGNYIVAGGGREGIFALISEIGYDINDGASANTGDILFNDNTVNSTGDAMIFGFQNMLREMDGYSSSSIGNIEVSGNALNSAGNGISFESFDQIGYELGGMASAEMGDLLVCGNDINAGNETYEDSVGINAYMRSVGQNMEGHSSFAMGSMRFNHNRVNSTSDGMFVEPVVATHMEYNSSVSIGDSEMMYNTVNSSGSDGVFFAIVSAEELYGASSVRMGDLTVSHNSVNLTGGRANFGIVVGYGNTANDISDQSSVLVGNCTVSENTVHSSGKGIAVVKEGFAEEIHSGYSTGSFIKAGTVKINDNSVFAADWGIFYELTDIGHTVEYVYTVELESTQIMRNTVNASTGIYAYMEHVCTEGVGDIVTMQMGGMDIAENRISANETGGTGIRLDLRDMERGVYGISNTTIGDILVHDNIVDTSENGMMLQYLHSGETYDDAHTKLPGVRMYENSFNSTGTGLILGLTDNFRIYDSSVQDWGMVEVSDSTFNAKNGVEIEQNSVKPEVWIHDSTFTNPGYPGTSIGLNVYDSPEGAVTVERCTFDGYMDGIMAESAHLTVGSSTLSGITGKDVNMTNGAHVFMVDDSFDKSNVAFQDSNSTLDIGWYITVNVVTQSGGAVPYADVSSVSNTSAPNVFWNNFTVDENGQYILMLREYRENITGIIEQYNPYNMTGSKAGLTGWLSPDPTQIDASKDVYVVISDHVDPIVGEDTSDRNGTTGDPFTFRVNATDNICLDYVTVYYRYGSSGAYSSSMMSSPDGVHWSYTMDLPSDFVGEMEYYFVATDRAGNTRGNSSNPVPVPVADNDAPSGLVDGSPAVAHGPSYLFNMTISDNIGVSSVSVTYWVDSGNHTTVSMNGTGPWNYTIDLNCSWNSTLHYYFTARDAAGNVFAGPVTDVPVDDNEAPEITADNSDTAATTGDAFHFSVNATDNFEIDSVTVTYWFGNGTHHSLVLTGSGTYTGSITVDSASTDTLHYYFNVTDMAGNYVTGDVVDVNVADNDLPVITDRTEGEPEMGNNFIIIGEVTDNIGLDGVYVEYWFDDGTHFNESMTGIGDVWMFSITVPEDVAELHYIFHATDGTGWNGSGEAVLAVREPLDTDAPQVLDTTTAIPIVGREFTFSAAASDNVGVAGVYVEYWFDDSTHANVSMTEAGAHWEYGMTIPADVTELHYIFHAVDTSENWASNTEETKAVEATSSDSEAPEITDTTSGVPFSGMTFTFSANVTDNVGVAGVYVEYWFDDGEHSNVSMGDSGSGWTYSAVIPDGVNRMHYVLSARDTSGNWASIEEKELNVQSLIIDTEKPVIEDVQTPGTPTEGERLTFTISASDNVGLSEVYVVYWSDDNEPSMVLLSGDNGTYTGTITVPRGSELHYYPVAKDRAGNTAEGNQTDVGITPASASGGTVAAGVFGGSNLLLILIIVILLLAVIYLAATRNRGGKGGESMAAEVEAEETAPPVEEEMPSPEEPEDLPPEPEAEPEEDVPAAPEDGAEAEGGKDAPPEGDDEGTGEVLDLTDL